MDRRIESLERLASLRAAGHLSEQEYQAEKRRLLGTGTAPDFPQAHGNPSGKQNTLSRKLLIALVPVVVVLAGVLIYMFYPSEQYKSSGKTVAPLPEAKAAKPKILPPLAVVPEPCRGSSCKTLEARGWAGIEAGMTVARAESVSGLTLRDDQHYAGIEADCRRYIVRGGPTDLSMLVEGRVITSISAWGKGFRTPRNVKLGDAEATVRSKYANLREEPDIYGEPADKKLFYDVEGGRFGLKFAINKGRVSKITVGGASRGYVEGCL
jgi:hypothetical protein